ncbi:hypothetical protein [Erwinia sp.]|uniref:hypothetical protein n=1 Tax=Erwinia citreus TaxID=558 RepID=UPI003C71EC0D
MKGLTVCLNHKRRDRALVNILHIIGFPRLCPCARLPSWSGRLASDNPAYPHRCRDWGGGAEKRPADDFKNMRFFQRLANHNYEGIGLDLDEQQRIVADLKIAEQQGTPLLRDGKGLTTALVFVTVFVRCPLKLVRK